MINTNSNAQSSVSEDKEDRSNSPCSYPIIPRDDLDIGEQLGVGSFGAVYRALWKSRNISVAVKKVFMLEKEAYILSRIRHRNIIQLHGVCPTNPEFFIVTEYAELGSLYDHLHNSKYPDVPFAETLLWAIQIAQGVHYLHYEAPDTIIHRDLKSKNVVLNDKKICKLCDFGTSKNLTHSQTAPTWGGTAAWMSPEIIKQSSGISTATDVWSYAVVVWELMSREIPYDGLTEFRIYTMIAEEHVKLAIPDTCPEQLAKLMNNCWKVLPKERINFKTILSELCAMKTNTELNRKGEIFIARKDSWRFAIDDQHIQLKAKELDLIHKTAELERWEKSLTEREASQRNLQSFSTVCSTDDVNTWDEEHVCAWLINLHLGMDVNILDAMVKSIQKNNINGSRLVDLSFNDLEYLGLKSYGLRKELLREITALREMNDRLRNFPSLATTQEMLRQQALEKTTQPLVLNMVLHVTMHQRQGGMFFDSAERFKVLVDCDWLETDNIEKMSPELREPHSLIQSVCITILQDQNTPLGDPTKRLQAPFGLATEWLDAPMDGSPVTAVCMVNFADRVIKPRSTRITIEIVEFSSPLTLLEKNVELTVRPFARSASYALDASSQPPNGMSVSASTPRLQGIWRDRISLSTSVDDIAEELPMAGHRPRSGSLSYAKSVHGDGDDDNSFFRPRTASGTMTKSPVWAQLAAGIRATNSSAQHSTTNSSNSNASDSARPRPIRTISEEENTVRDRTRHRSDRFDTHFGRRLHPSNQSGNFAEPLVKKPPVQRRLSQNNGDGPSRPSSQAHFFLDSSIDDEIALESQRSAESQEQQMQSRRKHKQRKLSITAPPDSSVTNEDSAKLPFRLGSAQVHGGYKKWAWKG